MSEWNNRAVLSSIRVQSPDIASDGQIWVQSSLAETTRMHRGAKEDFSFSRKDLIVIPNRGEDFATLILECIKAGESGLFIGSNRRGGLFIRESHQLKIRMKPGEVLTVRSMDAVEPEGRQDHGPVMIRPGQQLAM